MSKRTDGQTDGRSRPLIEIEVDFDRDHLIRIQENVRHLCGICHFCPYCQLCCIYYLKRLYHLCTMVQNSQEYRLKYWATQSLVRWLTLLTPSLVG